MNITKKILLSLILLPLSSIFGIDLQMLEGTWYRTYGIYRPWTDDNQGTFSYYTEELIFSPNNIVYVYDNSTEKLQGKSIYTILKRKKKNFIVFHTPEQDPNNTKIQNSQGFFIDFSTDSENHDIISLITVKEEKKKKKGIEYKKIKNINKNLEYIVPNNN